MILHIKFNKQFRLPSARKMLIKNEEFIKNQYIRVFERHDTVTKITIKFHQSELLELS